MGSRDPLIREHIDAYGCHVVLVPEDDEGPAFAYSIGLFETLSHPEVLVIGLGIDLMHRMINGVSERARAGERFEDGREYDGLLEGYRCAFRRVDSVFYDEYFGTAIRHYDHAEFPVLQCVWPDMKQRYPWEPGFPMGLLFRQYMLDFSPPGVVFDPLLSPAQIRIPARTPGERTLDWPFADPPNLATFTTRQVIEGDAPILLVTHDEDDGAWQFHTGKDCGEADGRLVALKTILARDPSVGDVAGLPLGWIARRASTTDDWICTPGDQKDEPTDDDVR